MTLRWGVHIHSPHDDPPPPPHTRSLSLALALTLSLLAACSGDEFAGYETLQQPLTLTAHTLVAPGSRWKFRDDGTNQDTAWRQLRFDDSKWRSGPPPRDVSGKPNTVYFRRSFSLADKDAVVSLGLRLLRDDGAVVYLNGTEVLRDNMPAGKIIFATKAVSRVSGAAESVLGGAAMVNPAFLVSGTNVLAVEVHQFGDSTDLSFDLELVARMATRPAAPSDLRATSGSTSQVGLAWKDNAKDETGHEIQRSPDGTTFAPLATVGANVTGHTDRNLTRNTRYYYRVRAIGQHRSSAFSDTATAVTRSTEPPAPPPVPPEATLLIQKGSTWAYRDDGTDQGTAWRAATFNDGSWKRGLARLGYGGDGEKTTLGFGPDPQRKFVTTYFRQQFMVGDKRQVKSLVLRLLRDDGAVVYLNGTEALRDNMPAQPAAITRSTLAPRLVGGADEHRFREFTLDATPLVDGTNMLAVELHQWNPASSDISLDLDLYGLPPRSAPPEFSGSVDPEGSSRPNEAALSRQVPDFTDPSEFRLAAPTSAAFLAPQATAAAAPPVPAPFTVRLTRVTVGKLFKPWPASRNVDAVVSINNRPNVTGNVFFCQNPLGTGQNPCIFPPPATIDVEFSRNVISDAAIVPVRIELIERDNAGVDDHPLTVDLEVSNQTGKWSGGATWPANCAYTSDYSWGICWEIVPSGRPVLDYAVSLCGTWNAQFFDSGYGEDFAKVRNTFEALPAAYAGVSAFVLGPGGSGAAGIGGRFLDSKGCILVDAAFSDLMMTPATPGNAAILSMRQETRFRKPGHGPEPISFTVGPAASGHLEGTFRVDKTNGNVPSWRRVQNWLVPPPQVTLTFDGRSHNDATRVSAIVSQILSANDMGIVPGKYRIITDQGCPSTLFPNDSCAVGDVVYIGPGVPGHGPQSKWKYIVAHEIGHQIQGRALAGRIGGYYTFPRRPGQPASQVCGAGACDPPEAPDLCACAHVDSSNKYHCLQSLEHDEDAQLEGFAQFFAAKAWNRQDEDDCQFNYYKEFLNPVCLPGAEKCEPFGGRTRVLPPVPVSCRQPAKWRNRNCAVPKFATEFDWMGFYWSVNTGGDTGSRLLMDDVHKLYRQACGTNGCSSGNVVSWEAIVKAAEDAFGMIDPRARRVRNAGFAFGVDRNTQP